MYAVKPSKINACGGLATFYFPIWWYVAPTIINTFLEKYDFTGKKIVLFATSGGSGFGNTVSELKISAHDAVIVEGKVFHKAAKQEIAEWVRSIL